MPSTFADTCGTQLAVTRRYDRSPQPAEAPVTVDAYHEYTAAENFRSVPLRTDTFLLLYVMDGELRIRYPSRERDLYPGVICFISAGETLELERLAETAAFSVLYLSGVLVQRLHDIFLRNRTLFNSFNMPEFYIRESMIVDMLREGSLSAELDASTHLDHILTKMVKLSLVEPEYKNPPEYMMEVLSYMRNHLGDPITVSAAAKHFSFSESHFRRIFSASFHCTPHEYIARLRLQRSARLLVQTDLSVSSIAETTGYSGDAYFIQAFRNAMGLTPLQYRREMRSGSSHSV